MEKIFSIEKAAKAVGTTAETLRHYDRIGLVKPCKTDEWTGYRYYSERELVRLNTVRALRCMDLSLKEIKEILELDDFEKINEELRQYSPDLAARPMIVAANKEDLLPPESDNLERLKAHVEAQGYEFYVISAATTKGTKELMRTIAGKLANLPPVTVYEPEYVKPLAEAGDAKELQIQQYDDLWVVSGPWIMKLMNDINFDDYESRMYFDRQLRKSGLFERLEEMGIQDGDTVSIFDFEFEYTK